MKASPCSPFSPNWLHVGTAVLNVLWFFVFGIIVLVDFGSTTVVVAAEGVIVLFVAGPFFLMFLYSLRLRSMAKKEEAAPAATTAATPAAAPAADAKKAEAAKPAAKK